MTEASSTNRSLKKILAIAFDVDGVLTDGGLWWGTEGEEWKRFSFADIMGISLARRAGLQLALISGEDSPLVDRYAQKMLIQHVVKGTRDKATALRAFAIASGIDLSEICFMGDDINDLPAMRIAGFSAAPSNASADVLDEADFVTQKPGGNGAVRELIEALLREQGLSIQEVFLRT
jgi:3-deoxy-D-manno-octulosonate 8-phosphate phosphatase (KDO 8-P phosphatase)